MDGEEIEKWQDNVSHELGSIGEKVAKRWLERCGYEVHTWDSVRSKIKDYTSLPSRLRRIRKSETYEIARQHFNRVESFLNKLYGNKLESMVRAEDEMAQLEKIIRVHSSSLRVGFDFIAKKDSEVFLVEVKANESELTRYQKEILDLGKKNGFKGIIVRPKIRIEISSRVECQFL